MNKLTSVKKGLMAIAAAISVFVVSFAGLPAHGASFDCAKAKSVMEKSICANPKLSKLDEEVNVAYTAAKNSGNTEAITSQQRSWLKERNACKTSDCIETLYTQRLKELETIQSASTVLRQIARSGEQDAPQAISSAEDFLKPSNKEFPPYPDIWGVDLPLGVSVFGIYPAGNGDFVVGAYGKEKSTYNWVSRNETYLMTGLFSGKQWRIAERDPMLLKNRNNNGAVSDRKEITCPKPLPPDDPNGRDTCYARIDHVFPNGNRLLYVSTSNPFPYCSHERYFEYLALVAPDGRLLRQATPIVVLKSTKNMEILGGDPPCEDLPGGKKQKYVNNWTKASEITDFIPLADGTFLLGFYGFFEGNDYKGYLIRFDQSFSSLHPAYGREVFMMDTQTLEKMGSIRSDPRRTIHENAVRTDRSIYDYLTTNKGGK